MSDFGHGKWIQGRKQHRCDYCTGPIPQGEQHYNYCGLYDGEWQNWRMHGECFDSYDLSDDGEFGFGDADMPARIWKLVNDSAVARGIIPPEVLQ